MTQTHLAIFSKTVADQVFTLEKRVDMRLSQVKSSPFRQIAAGDRIFVKVSGGKVVGEFTVGRLVFYEQLDDFLQKQLKREYGKLIKMPADFWQSHHKARYATVIFIHSPRRFLKPIVVNKHDLRAWVVLDNDSKRRFFVKVP